MANPDESSTWRFVRFGLIVTGEGEEEFLPSLFRSLTEGGQCTFEVLRRIGQRSPITSPKKKLRMVGRGQIITDTDEEEIGLTARRYLMRKDTYVILVDDLEGDRVEQHAAVYQRYRQVLDTMLGPLKFRASVHFLVNMLEAYYFADAKAINSVLGTVLTDHESDVETIGNPKAELKQLFSDFHEIEHGKRIVAQLDVPHVLSRAHTCASLRTLFAWCSRAVGVPFAERYRLADGIRHPVTSAQIDQLLP